MEGGGDGRRRVRGRRTCGDGGGREGLYKWRCGSFFLLPVLLVVNDGNQPGEPESDGTVLGEHGEAVREEGSDVQPRQRHVLPRHSSYQVVYLLCLLHSLFGLW